MGQNPYHCGTRMTLVKKYEVIAPRSFAACFCAGLPFCRSAPLRDGLRQRGVVSFAALDGMSKLMP